MSEPTPICECCGRGGDNLEQKLAEAVHDRQNADQEVRRLRRLVTMLKTELADRRRDAPEHEAVDRLHDRWQRKLNHPKAKLGPAREKAYLFGLRTYDEEMCNRAIDGCAVMPFVGPHGRQPTPERGGKRHDDPTLIFRDETTIERFAGYTETPVDVPPSQSRLRVERLAWGFWRADGGGAFAGAAYWPEVREQQVKRADRALRFAREGIGFVERADLPDREALKVLGVQQVKPLDLRNVLEAFEERGLKVIGRGAQFKGQCPIHEDRTPSCSITEKPDGATLLNCFGCQAGHIELARALDLYGRDRDQGPRPSVGQTTLEMAA